MISHELVITKRDSHKRGSTDLGWLDSKHSFSFGGYIDPDHVGYRSLRVINEDIVAPSKGFGAHQHRSMEILTYVISGKLEHKDSLGNGRIIKAGEFQYMSAGTGVVHSEMNPDPDNAAYFLQIWIQPKEQGGAPRYRDFDTKDKRIPNGLLLLASPDGQHGSASIRQDAEIHFGDLEASKSISIQAENAYPYSWIQIIQSDLEISGETFKPGDGVAIEGGDFTINANERTQFILFRLS
ncbi:MAG: pirin family protein [Opitutales bacterium]